MKIALFYQSVISDWNHGNAHFLRGLMRALQLRGHDVICHEQVDNWSLSNLLIDHPDAIAAFQASFPDLRFNRYALGLNLDDDLARMLDGVDAAIVHEWNDPAVIRAVAAICRQRGIRAIFHDTHYRVVLDAGYRDQIGLDGFDDIIAFSGSLADRYAALGFRNVTVIHEGADTTVFRPIDLPATDDVVYVGNYGDGDRSADLERYVFDVRRTLPDLRFAVYGVRYPAEVVRRFRNGLAVEYRGWIANAATPEAYSRARTTLHIPRRQYVDLLPGTPTIRVFEVLATATCLISLPWSDREGLFSAGLDYLVVRTPDEMREAIRWVCQDDAARERIGRQGRETILARHTCDHRANELLAVLR